MKGKIFMLLFALPFVGVGVWMTFSVCSHVFDAFRMSDWEPVQANVLSGGYEVHSGEDADTYEAYGEYTYAYGGRRYRSDRVTIASGGDNIGDYQRDLGRALSRASTGGHQVTVYVNPDAPHQAIYDRALRWGLLAFKALFMLVFGGAGVGMLIFGWKASRQQKKDKDDSAYADAPWRVNDEWDGSPIRSGAKASMYFAWGFAIFWNLVSAPLPFLLYTEVVDRDNRLALIGLIFPCVGLWLLYWAACRTREWRRFGAAPLTLDPFPGSIGGNVGGRIELNLPFDPQHRFSLTLSCVKSDVTGSGSDRNRRESSQWQETQLAHCRHGGRGTELQFCFDVPAHLQPSDASKDQDSYHLWRLNLHAELPEVHIDRDYEIPVYATAQTSAGLDEHSLAQSRGLQAQIDDAAVGEIYAVESLPGGRKLIYPMGRHAGIGVGLCVIGAIFAGLGWFLLVSENEMLLGGAFGAVGSLVALGGLYVLSSSLEVSSIHGQVTSTRRILGVAVRSRTFKVSDFMCFDLNTSFQVQSGGKHTVYYNLDALDVGQQAVRVGEGFKGVNQAKAAQLRIARELGLPQPDCSPTLPGALVL